MRSESLELSIEDAIIQNVGRHDWKILSVNLFSVISLQSIDYHPQIQQGSHRLQTPPAMLHLRPSRPWLQEIVQSVSCLQRVLLHAKPKAACESHCFRLAATSSSLSLCANTASSIKPEIRSIRFSGAVVSVFWAFLSSRHSSALCCFYCIVSVLINKIFIHSFISLCRQRRAEPWP